MSRWLLLAVAALGLAASAQAELTKQQRAAIDALVRRSSAEIWFQENVGQFPEKVRYGFKTGFGSMMVYDDHLRILANQTDRATGEVGVQAVDITFPGAGAWAIVPGGASGVDGAYMQANGSVLAPRIFRELTLRSVYEGVDLRLYSAEKGVLEFDWIVARAQDYGRIRIAATGQDGLTYHADGSATLGLRYQDLTLNLPEIYQVIEGQKRPLGGAMVAAETAGTMRYAISGELVADQPLVIDPNVVWSTYIDLDDLATDTTDSTPSAPFDSYIFAVNANANGTYASGWVKEIITSGSYANYMEVNAGYAQGTVVNQTYLYRLSNDGLHITAWTCTGVTSPTGGVTNQKLGAVPADLELFPDGRVILAFGHGLVQIYGADLSTRSYSGSPVTMDTLNSIAVVNDNSFYIGGRVAAAIPTTEIAAANIGPDSTFGGTLEGVIIRYSDAATTPTPDWATYVGGDGAEYFTAVAMTPDGTKVAFATSTAGGTASSFGTLVNAVDSTISGTELVIGVLPEAATKPAAFSMLSFLGGTGDEGTTATDTMAAVVTATNTHFYVGGTTASTDLPGSTGGAQAANGGGVFDAFVARVPLNGSAGSGFQTSYIGGSLEDRIGGIAYDSRANELLVFGSTKGSFPALDSTPSSNYYVGTFGGGTYDIFVATFNGALTTKRYATYIGGSSNDYLGQTGELVGQGHVVYSQATGLTYLATTVHSANLPAGAIGTPPGKDRVKSNGTNDTHFIVAFNINTFDYGDAPVSYEGGTPASEAISSTLRIGTTVDAEAVPANGAGATGDDLLTTADEDGLPAAPVLLTTETSHTIDVSVFNNTGAARTLYGWIDFNANGVFEAGEAASVSVPSSASQQTATLSWPTLPAFSAGTSYLRLRFSTATLTDNAGTANIDERSIGSGGFGEIEDYALSIQPLNLSVSDVTVTEGTDAYAVFTVSLSAPSPSSVMVALTLATGTAGTSDYGPGLEVSINGGGSWSASTSATFTPGLTSVLVRTPIVNDTLDENAETFTLTATTSAGSTTNPSATGTGTITDDDGPPSFSIDSVTRNEKAGTMTFTVTLSTASGLATSVQYATTDGTATAGSDYAAASGTLNFPAGTVTRTIVVTILDDTIFENSESFSVGLSNPTNATIATGTGTGTILDNGGGSGGTDDDRPTLGVSNVAVTEGTDAYAIFAVALSNQSAFATSFTLATTTGTASSADFGPGLEVSTNGGSSWASAASGTLMAGATSLLVRTPIVDDTLYEGVEAFTLTATVTAGTTTNAAATGTATITDNDPAPTFSIDSVTRNEKAGTMTFTVTLSAVSGLASTVQYATADGSATAGADYSTTSGTLNFPAGTVTRTIVVPILDDTVFENSESFSVGLSGPTNATIATGTGTGTILDNGGGSGGTDDDRPTLGVSNVAVTEGTDAYAVFAVTLSNQSAFATSFTLATTAGTASSADFGPGLEVSTNGGTSWSSAASGTLVAGATSLLVRTPIVDDTLDENAEAFTLTATVTAGTTTNAAATGTATITDDDAAPSFSIDSVTRNEKAGTMTFTVTLSAASGLASTVQYATADGSATAGADYTATSGTLNFPAGAVTRTIVVPILDDTIFENSESFSVGLSGPTNATIGTGTGTGTILDNGGGSGGTDDDRPTLSVSNVAVTEGTDAYAVFAVTLSNQSAFATSFTLATTAGTASTADFGPGLEVSTNGGTSWAPAVTGTLVANATSLLVRTPIVDDTLDENSEAFTLTATVTAGTTTNAAATGTATIADNDPPPTISINDVTRNEGAGVATFTVTLSTASSFSITVDYATAGGTATSDVDFSATSGQLTFAPGTTSRTIDVPIINDAVFEHSESFTVVLSNPASATIADGTGLGTILDDGSGGGGTDDDRPTLAVSNASALEGTDAFAIFTVTLSNASDLSTTVSLTLADGSATAADYGPGTEVSTNAGTSWSAAGTATFTPGKTSVFVRTAIIDDTLNENAETFTLTATVTAGMTVNASAFGTGTINDNDGPPSLSIDSVTRNENAGTATFTVTLSTASGLPVSVQYASANGTALAGADYTAVSGTLNFAPGVVSQPITVLLTDDTTYETTETFNVLLSGATNASIAVASGIGTILDDDPKPNTPPVAVDDSATTTEDTPVNITALVNDSDADNDPLTVTTATVPPTEGTVTINGGQTLRFTPAANFSGLATISYAISDGHGGTASAQVHVTVTAVNDPPVAVDNTARTPQEQAIVVDVLANDSDPESDTLSVTTATLVDGRGSVAVNADGTLTFTPGPAFTGLATVVYSISDGHGGTASAAVRITVDGLPIATDDFATTTTNTAKQIPVLDNDSDPEGLPLTIIDTYLLPSQGTLAIVPGPQLRFTPAPTAVGRVFGRYTIRDVAGNMASANVTIDITETAAPLPPIARSDSASTTLQTPVVIPVLTNDTDPANGVLTVTAATVPAAQGSVVINPDGTLSFTAAAGFEGIATIDYTIRNPLGATAYAPAIVHVAGSNAPPIARPDFATATSGVPKVVHPLTNDFDPDGDALTLVSATVAPAQGMVMVNPDGTATFTSVVAFAGTATIAYQINDGHGGVANSTVSIAVSAAPVNIPPVAVNDSATTRVDQPVDVPVLVNDHDDDGDALTVTGVTVPPGDGTATINADGTIHFVPSAGGNSDVVVTYTISDGQGGSATASLTINVNDNPVAVADRTETLPVTPVTVSVLNNDSDPNGNALTVTGAEGDPAEGTVVINAGGTLTFTPVAGFSGIAQLTYTITDGHGGFAQAAVFISVNNPPLPLDDGATTPLGQPVTVVVLTNDTDPDSDPLTVVGATVDPAQGTVVVNPDGTVTFTPAATFTGPVSIPYTITDRNGSQRSANILITRGNAVPTANARTVCTYCATPLRINPRRTANDMDGDVLTILSVTQGRNGRVVIMNDGTILYRPKLNYANATRDSFTITLSDGKGGVTTETINVRSFASIAGTFQGLLSNSAASSSGGALVNRGRVTVTLNNRASVSARLEIDGAIYRFTGALQGALTYQREFRMGSERATLTLTYDDLADDWSATLTGASTAVQQHTSGVQRRSTRARSAATYQVQLEPRGGGVAPGQAIIRVNRSGAASMVGTLPGGAAFSSGAFLDARGSLGAFYSWIVRGASRVAGVVDFSAPAPIPAGLLERSDDPTGVVAPVMIDLTSMP